MDSYSAYLAEHEMGATHYRFPDPVHAGSDILGFPITAPRLARTHFVLYTSSALTAQTSPSALLFTEVAQRTMVHNLAPRARGWR